MKKYILTFILLTISLLHIKGQNDAGFTNVPMLNGKVVFEQFIPADQGVTANQRYALLQKWVKKPTPVIRCCWAFVSTIKPALLP